MSWFPQSGFGRFSPSGFTDMGRIRIPPLPKYIGFTDRDNGTIWYLQHTLTSPGVDGNGYISISDVQPGPDKDWVIYGPYDGPVIAGLRGQFPNIRLFVRGGYLGMEFFSDGVGEDNSGQILTRRGLAPETREINRPANWQAEHVVRISGGSDELGWTPRNVS